MNRSIAITGLARAGKDSVAARLVNTHGYVRVAFADRLKEAALKSDPWIPDPLSGEHVRLSFLVRMFGWETAKDHFPEVRRFLQDYGQTIREIDPQFWIKAAGDTVRAAWAAGRPVVVTDVRYRNEAEFLTAQDFLLVRVIRPGQPPGQHASERDMLNYPVHHTIVNDGSLEDLYAKASALA